ncbi:acyl-CoA thioesterase [Chitinophaga nivalis]|uniref:Thioesterase family protein n=1 Tax=Chitinophaga nivalis TaxID=2991709 RepID=A0ABT3IPK7_9BACT|nr:thioesterase family protein [Chitinophaga nivalis]MCW3464407.1 thioesterase family protein [Chitinophaga nivalis]MCW3485902.1 thioesterase family protein [Chitinophaga nivalis]
MNTFFEGPVLWSQIDANMHLRHSAYADFAAQARLNLLDQFGLTAAQFQALKIGPILFREELIYHREVSANDTVRVSCEISRCKKDGSRWSIRHELFRKDGIKAATIYVDGAWIDMQKRKLTALPPELMEKFQTLPRTEDFTEDPA